MLHISDMSLLIMVPMRPSWTFLTLAVVNGNQKHAHNVYEPSLFLWDRLVFSRWFNGAGDARCDPVQNLMGGELE